MGFHHFKGLLSQTVLPWLGVIPLKLHIYSKEPAQETGRYNQTFQLDFNRDLFLRKEDSQVPVWTYMTRNYSEGVKGITDSYLINLDGIHPRVMAYWWPAPGCCGKIWWIKKGMLNELISVLFLEEGNIAFIDGCWTNLDIHCSSCILWLCI